jgi:hypothetical protein
MRARTPVLVVMLVLAAAALGDAARVVQAAARQSKAGIGLESARFVAEVRAVRSVRAQAAGLAARDAGTTLTAGALEAASLAALSPDILFTRLYGCEGESGIEAVAGVSLDAAALTMAAQALAADGERLSRLSVLWREEGELLAVLARAGKGAGQAELKAAVKGLKKAAGDIARLTLASAGQGKPEEAMK